MTPAARLSAAIEILDRILAGNAAEQALTNWGRANRFAGSGDRAALRDLVFDVLRCKRSCAVLGGGETGRALVLGSMRAQGIDPATLFTGEGHAPSALTPAESLPVLPPEGLDALDCPDWLAPYFTTALGKDSTAVLQSLRQRAPVFLRVNAARSTVVAAQAQLAAENILTVPHHLAKNALQVTENARKIQNSSAYQSGIVELQDAASQAVVEALPLRDGMRVLDYCAGGGGKALAMAARADLALFAHDADPRRMRDLPARAKRAMAEITAVSSESLAKSAKFDLILTDVPCTGSGSWRRAPEAKWALTPERLAELVKIQAQIIEKTAKMVKPDGVLAYATCSVFADENQAQVDAFCARNPDWSVQFSHQWTPLEGGDGFYLALLRKKS